jgi:3-dehydroquinate synthase
MIIDVDLEYNPYKVVVDKIDKLSFDKRVAIVTNPTVSGYHLQYLLSKISAKNIEIVTIADGEKYKLLSTVETILEALFVAKFDRDSLIIAFGGGVIGDMSGFSASIYQRGIDFIQIPTTLLSQVDASVGGKTGVNNKFGKNLIGAFYQPKAVYIDPYFLSTLPTREFGAGVAEIIKMAVMFDIEFFEWLENNSLDNDENIKQAIIKSVQLKAKVVIEDEREKGDRAKLNYGHTFAHVIENETNYSQYLHGEAVSIGIVMANYLALELGMITQDDVNRINVLLQRYSLPLFYKIDDIDSFYDKFYLDKKTSNSQIKFILPLGLGDSTIKKNIDEKLVKEAINEFTQNS